MSPPPPLEVIFPDASPSVLARVVAHRRAPSSRLVFLRHAFASRLLSRTPRDGRGANVRHARMGTRRRLPTDADSIGTRRRATLVRRRAEARAR